MPKGLWTFPLKSASERVNFIPSPAVRSESRLESLERNDLMDTPSEEEFDRFTRIAASVLNVPVALVSLVDDHRQFFKSAVGLAQPWADARETPLTHSFCQHAVTTRLPLVINDAVAHPLTRDSGATLELGVAAYMGVPLIADDDEALGALCAIDSKPREWTAEELAFLQDLTKMLASTVSARRLRSELTLRETVLDAVLLQAAPAIALCDADGKIRHATPRLCELLGYTQAEMQNLNVLALQHGDDAVPGLIGRNELLAGQRREMSRKLRLLKRDGSWLSVHATTSIIRDPLGRFVTAMSTVQPLDAQGSQYPTPLDVAVGS